MKDINGGMPFALGPLLALCLLLGACATAPITESPAEVEAKIWEKELAIFRGRGQGDIGYYINSASDAYLGWPPVLPKPATLDGLKASASQAVALNGEVCSLTRKGFTLSGDTAIMYFLNHRTRLGEGMASEAEREVSQFYENVHVWTQENGQWRLIGGFARTVDAPRD